jgi:hypothetical protein
VDFLVPWRATATRVSAARAQRAASGTVTRWEIDVDPDGIAVQGVQPNANLGAYIFFYPAR